MLPIKEPGFPSFSCLFFSPKILLIFSICFLSASAFSFAMLLVSSSFFFSASSLAL